MRACASSSPDCAFARARACCCWGQAKNRGHRVPPRSLTRCLVPSVPPPHRCSIASCIMHVLLLTTTTTTCALTRAPLPNSAIKGSATHANNCPPSTALCHCNAVKRPPLCFGPCTRVWSVILIASRLVHSALHVHRQSMAWHSVLLRTLPAIRVFFACTCCRCHCCDIFWSTPHRRSYTRCSGGGS